MKKKLLFVMNHLHCGGAEKSLVSLLHSLDYTRFEVDLLLFKREGLFLSQVPETVSLLEAPPGYRYFDMSAKRAVLECARAGQFGTAVAIIQAAILFRRDGNAARREQKLWQYMQRAIPSLAQSYDAAIGFLEKTPVYFCIDKVQSNFKLGFIHNDYEKLGMDPELDRAPFRKLDYIVTVSDICGSVLRRVFPDYKDKVKVIHNIVSPAAIRELSLAAEPRLPDCTGITIVTVGRLHYQKGLDMAIHACRRLLDRGYPVTWFVVGEGSERAALESLINEQGVKDSFILLGQRDNPYPLMRQADLYVQPSRFEGKPIAIDEAKVLAKPIVATSFSTAVDQIHHMESGLIVAMDAEALGDGIARLIDDVGLRKAFEARLAGERLGTEAEMEKLYALIS